MFYDTTSTFHGEQHFRAYQSNQGNEMKLYHVYMDVRGETPNSEGVYGVGTGMNSGYFSIMAKNDKEARIKTQKGIDDGLEPYITSMGGVSLPSPSRITINFVSLQTEPFIT